MSSNLLHVPWRLLVFLGLHLLICEIWRSGPNGPLQGKLSRYLMYQSQTNYSFNLPHLEIQLVSILRGWGFCLACACRILREREGSS